MPKENIDCIAMDELRAELSWGQISGVVQLATTNRDYPIKMPATEENPSGWEFEGWHVTLDRDGINRLIRALRRARDSAFGADA